MEMREQVLIRILLFIARVVARPLPDDVRSDLRALCNHLQVTRWEESPTRSRTLDELYEEGGALGRAAWAIKVGTSNGKTIGLSSSECRALADYLSRPASGQGITV